MAQIKVQDSENTETNEDVGKLTHSVTTASSLLSFFTARLWVCVYLALICVSLVVGGEGREGVGGVTASKHCCRGNERAV